MDQCFHLRQHDAKDHWDKLITSFNDKRWFQLTKTPLKNKIYNLTKKKVQKLSKLQARHF